MRQQLRGCHLSAAPDHDIRQQGLLDLSEDPDDPQAGLLYPMLKSIDHRGVSVFSMSLARGVLDAVCMNISIAIDEYAW